MQELPHISIVIVNKNGGAYLQECIDSINSQKYPNLEVVLIDGKSTDNSLTIIEQNQSLFKYWIIEEDQGQYDAVQKGFSKTTGQIMAWINSDDKYLPGAFWSVANIFESFPEVQWLMGFPGEYSKEGTLVRRIGISWARWSVNRYLTFDFQFIQQESCFWRRELWDKAGGKMDLSFPLAGDMELWARFFRYSKLYTTTASFAGFRQHSKAQRSVKHRQEYLDQCRTVVKRERKRLPFSKLLPLPFLRLLGFFTGILFFFEVPWLRHLHRWLYGIPKLIGYDVAEHKYVRSERLVKLPPLYFGGRSIHRDSFKPEQE